jgi:two-component system chemotaxis sensor kinase CheA
MRREEGRLLTLKNSFRKLVMQVDSLALEAIMLDTEDIPGLGKVLKSLEAIEGSLGEVKGPSMLSIVRAMKGYIEKVILNEKSDLSPIETGISQLQEIARTLINGNEFDKDISPLLITLCQEETGPPAILLRPTQGSEVTAGEGLQGYEPADLKGQDHQNAEETKTPGIIIDDKEIITDFVMESLENLGTIEVKLMDLEQDPSDLEAINTIFRSFHTIKGVSGFLNFSKISKLSHIVESLLDKARSGELRIDGEIIDLILDSADILKMMIENVQASLDEGPPSEGGTDIKQTIAELEHLITKAEEEGKRPLGEILVAKGAVSKADVEGALLTKEEKHEKKIGEILVEQKKVETREAVSALREQKRFGQPTTLQLKVDTDKLDKLVDMVGELAITQSILRQNELIKTSNDRKLNHIISQLSQITAGIQRTAMALRMVPAKNTFQKMLRVVRDLAKKAGKEVQLVMSGENTEIDRNMVEEIYEPMIHMIRNSIDHGLESPEKREAGNKPREGTICLRAHHQRGDIVIEIEDDGRGLDTEKILKNARSQGLIGEGEKLTDAEINNLIFSPGLSTAETIDDISGRGMGMDVVNSKLERLRGRITVQSVEGKGTSFCIRLPLTLAMIDGMIVKVRGERYIIPSLSVRESFKPKKVECHTVMGEGEMIMVRDHLFPLIRLHRLFGLDGMDPSNGEDKAPWESLVVVVENQGRKKCLLVDELLGQEEVVIKGLGEGLKDLKGIAGGAVMEDGRVGLILDIAGIFNIAAEG